MRTLRKLSSVGAMLFLLALVVPLGAGARPPLAPGGPTSQPSLFGPLPSAAGAHLTVTRLSSAPAHARRGHAYVLRGFVRNEGTPRRAAASWFICFTSAAGRSPSGSAVRLAAHDSAAYRAHIRLPRVAPQGLVCARRVRAAAEGGAGRSGA